MVHLGTFTKGTAMTTQAEALGDAVEMHLQKCFSIEKYVTAKSRALKAEYTMELAQDLKQFTV